MKKFFLFFCYLKLSLLSFSQDASIKIDTNAILIGQQIKLTVECNDINVNSSFPVFLDTIITPRLSPEREFQSGNYAFF